MDPPPPFFPSPSQVSVVAVASAAKDEKPASMRGRKKHKCTVCGNTARSRCPFLACKSCCVKAKNPCFIHGKYSLNHGTPAYEFPSYLLPSKETPNISVVIKANQPQHASLSVGKTHLEQPAEIPSMSSSMGPLSRQISGQMMPHQGSAALSPAQQAFDSVRLRTAKSSGHLTRKEAMLINAWRFYKLKQYTESKLAAEDEAFDRYMQNVSLLEEVFALNAEPVEGLSQEGRFIIQSGNGNDEADIGFDTAKLSLALRTRFRTNSKRKEAHRQRVRRTIDRSMQKLHRGEREDISLENEDAYVGSLGVKRIKVQSKEGKERLKRMELFNALFVKLRHVENQADLKSCLEMYEENFVEMESSALGAWGDLAAIASSHNKTSVGPHSDENPKHANAGRGAKRTGNSVGRSARKASLDTHGISRGWWKVDINDNDIISSKEWMTAGVDLAAL